MSEMWLIEPESSRKREIMQDLSRLWVWPKGIFTTEKESLFLQEMREAFY